MSGTVSREIDSVVGSFGGKGAFRFRDSEDVGVLFSPALLSVVRPKGEREGIIYKRQKKRGE